MKLTSQQMQNRLKILLVIIFCLLILNSPSQLFAQTIIFDSAAQPVQQPWGEAQKNAGNGETIITVSNTVEQYGAKRLGINVGAYDPYGSAQFLKNVIPNPGFEAGEYAMIFLAAPGAKVNRVQPNRWHTPWNAQPNGFWDNAVFEILSGPARGRSGRISRFGIEGGRYTFYLTGGGAAPNVDDAIMVRREVPGYFPDRQTEYTSIDPNQKRPGSPGQQSLRVRPSFWTPAYAVSLDSFSRDGLANAGKLRLVEGNWQLSFWAKAQHAGQSLEIKFYRVKENSFFVQTFPLTQQWQKIEHRFSVPNGADPLNKHRQPLSFEIRVAEGEGDIWLDDVSLGEADNWNPTVFSDDYVNLLRELKPGVLRYWGKQLGSSLDNQLSHQFARQTVGYDPYRSDPSLYAFSLHEFLQLAQAVGAEPWYVIPPTFNAAEMQNLAAYLAAPAGSHSYANLRASLGQGAPWANVFSQIHLEFGNELWGDNSGGDPFRGSSLFGGERLGEVANYRFGQMRHSPFFNEYKLDLIVGGQAGFAGRQAEIQSTSSTHDTIALAPYFGDATRFNSDGNLYYPLFASPTQAVSDAGKMRQSRNFIDNAGKGTEMAIYEINFHLIPNNMPIYKRNEFYTGMGGGLALPLHMLTYQRDLGIRRQAAFTSAQYATRIPTRAWEWTQLWGLLVDVEATGRKRPGWLGMEIVNKAVRGDMITTAQSGKNPTWRQQPMNGIRQAVEVPYIQSFAFKQGGRYGLVLFNLNLWQAESVLLQLPASGQGTLHKLTSPSIRSNNETAETVRITSESFYVGNNSRLQLPAHSIYVLEW